MYYRLLPSLLLLPSALGVVIRQSTVDGITTGVRSYQLSMSISRSMLTISQTLGNATAVDSNPQGASFKATFPTDKQFTPTPNGNVKGVVLAQTGRDGKGVRFDVMLDNLPDEGGPFCRSKT